MLLTDLHVSRREWEGATGWQLKPEGACRGEVCIPLGGQSGDPVDVEALARRLGMPLVHDEAHGLWSLGPATVTGRALSTAAAPELELPDLDGNAFSLSSLRGQKVMLLAWASW